MAADAAIRRARWPGTALAAFALGLALAACAGQATLSSEQFAWCSTPQHMAREVGDEARAEGLTAPANAAGLTDDALYWATYFYRANKVSELRTEPGFVRACRAAYAQTH